MKPGLGAYGGSGGLRIGLLGWLVDCLDDNVLRLVGLIRLPGGIVVEQRKFHLLVVLVLVLLVVILILVLLEAAVEQPKALALEVEPAEVGLEVVGRRSIETAPPLADPGFLLALDLLFFELDTTYNISDEAEFRMCAYWM